MSERNGLERMVGWLEGELKALAADQARGWAPDGAVSAIETALEKAQEIQAEEVDRAVAEAAAKQPTEAKARPVKPGFLAFVGSAILGWLS